MAAWIHSSRDIGLCAVSACEARVPEGLLMCREHWSMVPREVRRRVSRAWRRLNSGIVTQGKMDAYREARIEALAGFGGIRDGG